MTATATAPALTHDAQLYLDVTHFYGRQMRAMDTGDSRAWAETFVPDGTFEANAHPTSCIGRESIAASSRAAYEAMTAAGLRRRHWLGMLEVDRIDDDTILVRSYAQMLQTAIGGQTELRYSTTCDDVLTRVDGQLQVVRRTVQRDDLA